MPTIDEVIKAIPNFSPAEQDRINAAIKASRSLGGKRSRGVALRSDMQDHTVLILNAICTDLKKHGNDNTTMDMAAQFSNYTKFTTAAKAVGGFIGDHGFTVGQRRHLASMMAGLLRADLEKMDLAVTVRLMMTHTHRMQACFTRAFPGYVDAGLIHLVVNGKEQEHGR